MGTCILFLLHFLKAEWKCGFFQQSLDNSNVSYAAAVQQWFFVEIYAPLALGAKKNVCINNTALDAIM